MDKNKVPSPLDVVTSNDKVTLTESDMQEGMSMATKALNKVLDKHKGKQVSILTLMKDGIREIFKPEQPINIDNHQKKELTDGTE